MECLLNNQPEIKRIPPEDYPRMAKLMQRAYPRVFGQDQSENAPIAGVFEELCADEHIEAYGAYFDKELAGCLLYYRFEYNFHGKMIRTAGIGNVAVDLLHKKKKVAQQMFDYVFQKAADEGIPMFMLYPFSVPFYKNFGFGLGTPLQTFTTAPSHFKDFGLRHLIQEGDKSNLDDLFKWIDDLAVSEDSHGMAKVTALDQRRMKKASKESLILAVEDGKLLGFMTFEQMGTKEKHAQSQKIVVSNLLYEDVRALKAFSSFFNAQADQVTYVDWFSYDRHIPWLLSDLSFTEEPNRLPLISHKYAEQSLGLMYRALDPQTLLNELSERLPQNLTCHVTVCVPKAGAQKASGLADEVHAYTVKGTGNEALSEPLSVALDFELHAFSSWVMGCISLVDSLMFGELQTSAEKAVLKQMDQWLGLTPPTCYTRF